MMILGHDLSFWVAMFGASLFKLITSPRMTWFRSLATVFAAVFCAVIFTDPAIVWLGLDQKTYKIPVAVLIGLTGESLLKWLIFFINNPKEAAEIWKAWRLK